MAAGAWSLRESIEVYSVLKKGMQNGYYCSYRKELLPKWRCVARETRKGQKQIQRPQREIRKKSHNSVLSFLTQECLVATEPETVTNRKCVFAKLQRAVFIDIQQQCRVHKAADICFIQICL